MALHDALPAWPSLWGFIAASLVLTLTPGPGVLFIVSRSLVHGRRGGLASVLGIAAGNLANAVAASIGLAALFAVSPLAFNVVKFAGAAWLLWLGIRMWRDDGREPAGTIAASPASRLLREGFLVALLNPKTTLFFAAFLPQFVTARERAIQQSLALGVLFVLIALVTDGLYALGAGSASRLLSSTTSRRRGRRLAGSLYIALGLFTAMGRLQGR
jgi:threonine/homoserine/homoserine lactone efflux protein